MKSITKSLGKYEVSVEVWTEANFRPSYVGYAFCPVKDCKRSEAFQAPRRLTERKAAGDAFAMLKKHFMGVHKQ